MVMGGGPEARTDRTKAAWDSGILLSVQDRAQRRVAFLLCGVERAGVGADMGGKCGSSRETAEHGHVEAMDP